MTDIRLAWPTKHPVTGIWRLQLDPHGDQDGKVNDIPDFGGSIHGDRDLEKITAILGSWGVTPEVPLWKDTEGGWVVPVLQHPR